MKLSFDAVVFDLDGTLIATDEFWIPAARAATRRVFAERRISRVQPSGEQWMQLVGHPMEIGLRIVLPDLAQDDLEALMAACIEEEEAALESHGAKLLPGAAAMLDELVAMGMSLGIASNCGGRYLAHMMDDLGLSKWIGEARCLDSPGIRDKRGMVADVMLSFGAERGVMVGDRFGDMYAGRENGLVCVGYTGSFGDRPEQLQADVVIEHLADFVSVMGDFALAR